MNTQNILKYYGTKLDVRLDSSEYYDYELTDNENDYNTEVLDFDTPINYSSLTINYNTTGYTNQKTTISFCEFDNTINDPNYIYSGLTFTIDYQNFMNYMGVNFEDTFLNNYVLEYSGFTNEIHYFEICNYNQPLDVDIRFNDLITNRLIDQNGDLLLTQSGDYINY